MEGKKYTCGTCKHYQNTEEKFICNTCKNCIDNGEQKLSGWEPKEVTGESNND